MRLMPLFLIIEGDSQAPQFHASGNNSISFQGNTYDFSAIFKDLIPPNALHRLTNTSATLVLVGPTASGKTTSLHDILTYFVTLDGNVQVTACEVNKNNCSVDLLDGSASKKYLGSIPFNTQLRKVTLDGRLVAKLMRERAAASTAPNTLSSRLCLLVNIYGGTKLLTLVDMMGNEEFNSNTCNSFANSSVSSLPHHLVAGSHAGRSHNLVTNLIFRRVSSTNISFIMHLDANGETDLIKSSLTNFTLAVNSFRSNQCNLSGAGLSSPLASKMPNYARPTVSSGSPKQTLLSFKVNKPVVKKRVAHSATDYSGAKRQMGPLRRTFHHLHADSASPVTDVLKVRKLQEKAGTLERQLAESKALYVSTLEALQAQVRFIKSDSFPALQNDLLKSREGLQNITQQLKGQKQNALMLEEKLSQLRYEKNEIEAKLLEVLQLLHDRTQEFSETKEASEEEKRTMEANFESELSQLREKSLLFEKELTSLTELKNQAELETSKLLGERVSLQNKTETLRDKLNEVSEEKQRLEKQLSDIRGLVVSAESSYADIQTELSEKNTQLQNLQEQLVSTTDALAHKSSVLQEKATASEQYLAKIGLLEHHLESQSRELSQKEDELRSSIESERAKRDSEVQNLESRVAEITKKSASLETLKKVQEQEILALKATLNEKDMALSHAQMYKDKCFLLESNVQALSEKIKQKDMDHEKHIMRLNKELGKAKGITSSPKKLLEYPDLDFNNGNNTFSSIDIFEDQTEYMNVFKRPALGKSPVASPTRVLTKSNLRVNIDPRSHNKFPLIWRQSGESTQLLGQENSANR